ncbi:MAG: chorismate-binding protein [Varibaculum sp.]|nr:chorismate-binding protein [Varibaculum sp.]
MEGQVSEFRVLRYREPVRVSAALTAIRGSGNDLWIAPNLAIISLTDALPVTDYRVGPRATGDAKFVADARVPAGWEPLADGGELPICLPVALASFPFLPGGEAYFGIPRRAVVIVEGRAYLVAQENGAVSDNWWEGYLPDFAAVELVLDKAAGEAMRPDSPPDLLSDVELKSWMRAVQSVQEHIAAGEAQKVVLARQLSGTSETPIDERGLIARLWWRYHEDCWIYAVDGLLGATPEMLAQVCQGAFSARVLAGSAPVGQGRELLASAKNLAEHRVAVDSVREALTGVLPQLRISVEPELLELPNVVHLSTRVEADSAGHTVLELVAALHPTAAVCGMPRETAGDLINRFEGLDRGRYAGPVGWVDADGNGQLAIALRCVELRGRDWRVFAGAGIMPDSDPQREFAETATKMRPVLDALFGAASSRRIGDSNP